MATDRVQMKAEEIVGDEVVLKDINPKTNTPSVIDDSSGARLNQTLDRIWNSINNKLSRIVNSVNGRTGVVVLRAEDVGLGNVDNISLSDIKQWVINKLNEEFGNKRMKLFDTLQEAIDLVAENDLVNADSPYYAKSGVGSDKLAYIGYIFKDPGTNTLSHAYKSVNVVGYTDESLLYNETAGSKDYTGGGLGVNILNTEDALALYQGLNKADSGLYIKKDKIVAEVYQYEGVYGTGVSTDPDAFLYFANAPADAKLVELWLDGTKILATNPMYLKQTNFKVGDIIICNFKDYRTPVYNAQNPPQFTGMSTPVGMCTELMCRQNAIGRVNHVSTSVEDPYRIDFISIKQNIGWGIQAVEDHRSENVTGIELGVKPIVCTNDDDEETNMSGIQVLRGRTEENPININVPGDTPPIALLIRTEPQGYATMSTENGGLLVETDVSLAINPFNEYGPGNKHLNVVSNNNDVHDPGDPAVYADPTVQYGKTIVQCFTMPDEDDADLDKIYQYIGRVPAGPEQPFSRNNFYNVIEEVGIRFWASWDQTTSPISTKPYGSKKIGNWSVVCHTDPTDDSTLHEAGMPNGTLNKSCPIGINLTKMIDQLVDTGGYQEDEYFPAHGSSMAAINISGLRINPLYNTLYAQETFEYTPEWFGMTAAEGASRLPSRCSQISGGVSVNVGDFLEIEPTTRRSTHNNLIPPDGMEDYYDTGKVNVRIGAGLTGDLPSGQPGRRIKVSLQPNGGLAFDSEGRLYVVGVGHE